MKHNDSGMPKGVKAILFGTIGGMILCTAELLLAAGALSQLKTIPDSALSTITMVFASLGALGGGYIAVRIAKCRGMFYGVLTGMALFFVVVIAGLCMSTESITLATVIKAAAMLLSGAVGGVVAVNRKQRVR